MGDDNIKKAVADATIKQDNIKIASNDPSLKGKIHMNIDGPASSVYWYIRFNIPLDPESVSKYTMNVTETNGYILNTIITYDTNKNLIVLNPIDLYRQNEFYILTVSKKVRSVKGNPLKKEIHILFKLIDNQISEFQILKSTVKVPKPRQKPESVKKQEAAALANGSSRMYSFDTPTMAKLKKATLPYAPVGLNVLLAVVGLLLILLSFFTQNIYFTVFSIVVSVIGIIHIIQQMTKKELRSVLHYTRGVIWFNFGRYKTAQKLFNQAVALDPHNEMAEYASNKVNYYL